MDSHAPRKTRSPANPVGDLLRDWRGRRAMSQAPTAATATAAMPMPRPSHTPKSAGAAADGAVVGAGAASPHAGLAEPAVAGLAVDDPSGAYVKVYVPDTG